MCTHTHTHIYMLTYVPLQMSYAHAFSAIRQLAVSLRGALNMKTKDGYKEVSVVRHA